MTDIKPVAWLKVWNSVGLAQTDMRRVDLTPDCEPWLQNMCPTITPLCTLADMEDALASMLPGPYYMDPPDGGSVTVLEQIRRMSEDAARWRALRDINCNSVTISRNDGPAINYTTAKDWIENIVPDNFVDCDKEQLEAMKATNTIWQLQIYPDNPVGFYVFYGATLDYVVDQLKGCAP